MKHLFGAIALVAGLVAAPRVEAQTTMAEQQCWGCRAIFQNGELVWFGCSPTAGGGGSCSTSCTGDTCTCTPSGACGGSMLIPGTTGEGSLLARSMERGDLSLVETVLADGSVQRRLRCNGLLVQREYTVTSAEALRRDSYQLHI